MKANRHISQSGGCRGVALVEASIVVVFLIFFMFGAFDIGRALNQYFLLSRIAYESVRLGTEQESLECANGQLEYPGDCAAVKPKYPNHCALNQKIAQLVIAQQARLLAAPSITTKCFGQPTGVTVTVSLKMDYKARYLIMMPTIPIYASATSSYLLSKPTN